LVQLMTDVENMPGYFLGVLTMLASGMPPTLDSYLALTAGITAGAFAGALPDIFSQDPETAKGGTKT